MFVQIKLNIKNILGWKTNRKIIVFSVDDYGNVRLASKKARENLDKVGVKIENRFDAYDGLETTEDLSILFETLSSYKDKNERHPVFTAYSLPCNIDFESVIKSDYKQYFCEELPVTFSKLKGYEDTWQMWQEGMQNGFLKPQFHGREHLNLRIFREKLDQKEAFLANRII